MGKSQKWTCEKIIRKFHAISEIEIEQRLAELWETLLSSNGQFHRSHALVPVKSHRPLLPDKRSKR
jgi:hypothetical protein